MKKFVARSAVFFNGDFFCIVTQSTGMLAYAEPDAPPRYLPPDVDDATIGKTLRIALVASKQIEPAEFQKIWKSGIIDQNDAARDTFAMQHYGYKSRRAMYKNMDNCLVSASDGMIEISPSHHHGIDGYSADKRIGPFPLSVSDTVTDAELGAAIREGFKRCTSSVK